MSRDTGKESDPYLQTRQVGQETVTLMLPGEKDGGWPWVLNRTDGEPHSTFGKPVASGRAPSREDALRALAAAFEAESRKIRAMAVTTVLLDTNIYDWIHTHRAVRHCDALIDAVWRGVEPTVLLHSQEALKNATGGIVGRREYMGDFMRGGEKLCEALTR